MKLRSTSLLSTLLAICVASDHGLAQPAPPRREVIDLVIKDALYMNADQRAVWQDQLRSRPDIKPDLLAMVEQYWVSNDWQALSYAMDALALRADLEPSELERIKERVGQILDASLDDQEDRLRVNYAIGLLRVVRNYPSTENEELALSFVRYPVRGVKINVAKTLAAIGSGKSKAAMDRLVDDLELPPGKINPGYDEVLSAQRQLVERLSSGVQTKPGVAVPQGRSPGSTDAESPKHATTQGQQGSPTNLASGKGALFAVIGILVITAAVGGIWMLLRKS